MKSRSVWLALVLCSASEVCFGWSSGSEEQHGPADARCVGFVLSWAPQQGADANEHAELLREAMRYAGLPSSLYDDSSGNPAVFSALSYVFAAANEANPGYCLGTQGVEPVSIIPVPFGQADISWTRSYTIPGFAALPDHSYSLWDWATGNETCPIAVIDPQNPPSAVQCHAFDSHMGPLNSTHFPPQSQVMYTWYHTIALNRAQACFNLYASFSASPIWTDAGSKSLAVGYIQECEREALSAEAVGQHYLQDNWAMGHMWQRWGSPRLADFQPKPPNKPIATLSPLTDALQRASAVGFAAGMIHGSDAVTEKRLNVDLKPLYNPQTYIALGLSSLDATAAAALAQALFNGAPSASIVGDEMSYGRDPKVNWRRSGDPIGLYYSGLGDLYSGALASPTNPNIGGSPPIDFSTELQGQRLITCSASGLLQVYATTAQMSGPLQPSSLTLVDPSGKECNSQRATNLSIYRGMGGNITTALGNVWIPIELLMGPLATLDGWFSGGASSNILGGFLHLNPSINGQLVREMLRNAHNAKYEATYYPTDVLLAESGITGEFMSVPLNGYFAQFGPAPDADPPLWPAAVAPGSTLQSPTDNARLIARIFHKSHVAEWCSDPEASPTLLRQNALNYGAGNPNADATLTECKEFVSRQIRTIDSQGNVQPSMCDAAGFGGRSISGQPGVNDRMAAAELYCLTSVTIAPANPSLAPNQGTLLTATETVRGVAVGTPNGFNWKSSNATIASVDPSGNVSGLTAGTATITATDPQNGVNGSTVVTVKGSSTSSYSITQIPSIGGDNVTAFAINNAGEVIGCSNTGRGSPNIVSWTWSAQGGLQIFGNGCSVGALNDGGQIVGNAASAPGSTYGSYGYLYTPGIGIQNLITLGGGSFLVVFPYAINNAGQVVGYALAPDSRCHGFIYSPGAGIQDLGVLDIPTVCQAAGAVGVNDSGQIAVNSITGTFTVGISPIQRTFSILHASIYTLGGSVLDLGNLGEPYSAVNGGAGSFGINTKTINNSGQVIGSSATGVVSAIGLGTGLIIHGFLYTPSTGMQDLCLLAGTPCNGPTGPISINNLGQVLLTNDNGTAIYSAQSGFTSLTTPLTSGGWALEATALNDKGQVLAIGSYNGQCCFAAVLTPQ